MTDLTHNQAERILNTISEACYELDREGKMVYVNRKTEELFQLKKDQLLGRNMWELFPQAMDSVCYDVIQVRALERHESSHVEYFSPILQRSVSLSATPTDNGCIVLFRETQELEDARQQLRKQEALLNNAERVGDFGCYEVELATMKFHFSDGLYRIFGYEPQSFAPSLAFIDTNSHPDDAPIVMQVLNKAASDKKPYYYSRRIYQPDGTLRIIESHGKVETDQKGNAIKFLGVVRDITEQKNAEQELIRMKDQLTRQANDRYRALFNSMDEGYILVQVMSNKKNEVSDLLYLEANPAAVRMAGEELVSRRTSELENAHYHSWCEVFGRVAETGISERHEVVLGHQGWVYDLYVFKVGGPAENKVAAIYSDITARKNTEEILRRSEDKFRSQLQREVDQRTAELKESQELLHAIAESQPVSLNAFKALRNEKDKIVDLECIFANSLAEALYEDPQLVGKRFRDVFTGAEAAGLYRKYTKVIETGKPYDYEYPYEKNGERGWYRAITVKMDDGVLVTTEDITARKKAEQQLNEQLHFINQVTYTIPDMLSVMDLHTYEIVYANTQPFLMNGFDYDKMKQLSREQRSQIIHPDDLHPVRNYFQNFREYSDDQIQSLEYRAENDDGQWMWYRVRGKVFKRDENGRPLQCVNIVQNINNLKVAEAELINLRLRQQREMSNAMIHVQEQERARIGEALHNGVAQLLYGVQTRIQLLSITSAEDKKVRKEILNILGEAINDTRRIAFELVPAVLKDYGIEVALKAHIQKVAQHGPQINTQIVLPDRLPEELEAAIYRIVQELINNVIKHAKATEASISVRRIMAGVAISVNDNGTGFDQRRLKKLSQGMGLQNVRNRVELLDGSFRISSGKKDGTKVDIVLPV